jgi:hypothetical protein
MNKEVKARRNSGELGGRLGSPKIFLLLLEINSRLSGENFYYFSHIT